MGYLSGIDESDYDKLIKLCDYISLPSGFCLIEKRLIDMAIRGGVNEYTIPRWESTLISPLLEIFYNICKNTNKSIII